MNAEFVRVVRELLVFHPQAAHFSTKIKMPLVDDIVAGAAEESKQQLQEALLELLKQNPDILDSVTKSSLNDGQTKINDCVPGNGKAIKDVRRAKRSQPFPEMHNSRRDDYDWNLSDNEGGIDSAWSTATRNMTPRELSRWRKSLFSIYVGNLPCDITKRELVQLFSEAGNVQDVHIHPSTTGSFTFGFVRYSTLEECRDALVDLHGRKIGNRTLFVEYACETRQRLENEDDANDLPLDKNDKLLKPEYPKVSYHCISETDSQEKTLLWKLRTSATKLSSQARVVKADVSISGGQDVSKEETFMSKIQEVVKKVVGLSVDTHSSPSLSECSPFSSWIQDRNNNSLSRESDKTPDEQNVPLKCSGVLEKTSLTNNRFSEEEQISVLSVVKEPLVAFTTQANNLDLLPSPDNQVNGKGNMSEGDLCPSSPACDTSSFSDTEAAASDSFSLESASPEQPVNKHWQFCHTSDAALPGVPPSSVEPSADQQLPVDRQPPAECHDCEAKLCEEVVNELVQQHLCHTQYKKNESSPHIHPVDEMDRDGVGFRKAGFCLSNSVELTVKNLPSCEGRSSKSTPCIPTESSSVASIGVTTSSFSQQNTPKTGKETLECQSHIVNTNTAVNECYERSERENTTWQRDPLPSGMSMDDKQRSTLDIDKNTALQPAPETESVIQRQEVNLGHIKNHMEHNKEQDNLVPPSREVESSPTMHATGTSGRGMLNSKPLTQPLVPPYLQSPNLTNIVGTGRNQPRVCWPRFDALPLLNPQLLNQMLLSQAGQLNANLFLQQQLMASGIPYRLPFQMGGNQAWANLAPRFPHPAVHVQGHKDYRGAHRRPNIGQTQPCGRQINNSDHPQPHFPGITTVKDIPNPPTTPVSVNVAPINNTHMASQDSTIGFKSDKSKKELLLPTSPCNESSPVVKAAFKTPSNAFHLKIKGDTANPGGKKVPSSKLNQSEIHFMELKDELENLMKENEKLRRSVYWKRSEREHGIHPEGKQEALESLIHLKEVQLQKEKEIIMARNTEQELLYEREKLETAFDQQLMKELEIEWRIADTKNRIVLAKMEGELLPLYQQLYRTREATD